MSATPVQTVGQAQRPGQMSGRPPFNPGDRLSRAEFERRCEAYPEIKKAELEVFPGLALQPAHLWSGDLAALLQEELNLPQHAAFVARLEKRQNRETPDR